MRSEGVAFRSSSVERPYGWLLIVVASLLMGFGAGSLISISTFLKPLTAELGWLRGETSLGYMAGALAMGIGGIVMGRIADRRATRPVVIVGLLVLGGSLLLLATQSALWQFYLYYCLLGGLGAAALDVPLLTCVGNWFDRNKGLALGLVTAGRALGQGLVPFTAGHLIAGSGWQAAYATLGLFCLGVLLPLAWFVRDPPSLAAARVASHASGPFRASPELPVPPRVAVAWLGTASIFCCVCMGTVMVHAVAIAEDAGLEAEQAAGVILLVYLSGFFGRIALGGLCDHIGPIRAYWISSFGQTVLLFWFTEMQSLAGFYALAVVFGFFMAGVMTCLTVCARELTPAHTRGTSLGVVYFLAWVGMGLGGYQGGLFFDLTGDYVASYLNATVSGAINVAIVAGLVFYVRGRRAALAAAASP
jgi:MFS family permease